jgi:putative nucleotidyltransferase with HDIG domain
MKRILFVDDEAHVLDGLRDLLRRQRGEWEMVFALGGESALRELDAGPFDVVVSDMRMPGIDGAMLLRLVQERHPETVRIVLSGQTEVESALRVVPVAHQFLAKPCDRDELRSSIERACLSRELLADEAVRRAVSGAEALPSAPALHAALTEKLGDPDVAVEDVVALIETDIAMAAKLLQVVNSSFFGLGRRITSLREAVVYLGMAPLRALALAAGAFRAFDSTGEIEGFSVEALEAHSVLVARLASQLLPDRREAEDAFAAGILHDIGKLVLAAYEPEQLAGMLAAARESARPLHAVERDHMGATHAEIGAYLLTVWGLPYRIVEAVAHHHAPSRLAGATFDAAAAVYIANLLVAEQERLGDGTGSGVVFDEAYLAELGVAGQLDSWRRLAATFVNQEER